VKSPTQRRPLHRQLRLATIAVVTLATIVTIVRCATDLWRERERGRAATALAERYLTLMNTGRCPQAQRLTVFPGSAQFCAATGENLRGVHIRCEHVEHKYERHRVNCDVDSDVRRAEQVVLIVERGGHLIVVDATARTDESFGPQ
jgi:hypothetical protein